MLRDLAEAYSEQCAYEEASSFFDQVLELVYGNDSFQDRKPQESYSRFLEKPKTNIEFEKQLAVLTDLVHQKRFEEAEALAA